MLTLSVAYYMVMTVTVVCAIHKVMEFDLTVYESFPTQFSANESVSNSSPIIDTERAERRAFMGGVSHSRKAKRYQNCQPAGCYSQAGFIGSVENPGTTVIRTQ